MANSKVKVVESRFHYHDAAVFAAMANDLIAMCNYPNVLYYQADEIWHEDLVDLTKKVLDKPNGIEGNGLSFWRVQLKYNFQHIKWFPHPVHRIGIKDNFKFVNDGMNTQVVFDTTMVSQHDLGMFTQWGDRYNKAITLPTNEMILDVSLTGGFLDNIPDRRRMHLPFWNESDVMPSDEGAMGIDEWHMAQKQNID